MNKLYLIKVLLILLCSKVFAAEIEDTLMISSASIADQKIILADNSNKIKWKFKQGDDFNWASPNFDDSDWQLVNPWLDMQQFDYSGWDGICWFRKTIRIDSTLTNTSFGVDIHHDGASEIYLNGKQILNFGVVSATKEKEVPVNPMFAPFVLSFDTSLVYTIAIRYSNHGAERNEYLYNKFFSHLGFSLSLFDFNDNIENKLLEYYRDLAFGWGLDGFTLAFSIIFFLLYFFYSKRKENLYFALFIFGLSLFGGASNLQAMGPVPLEIEALLRFLQFAGVTLIFTFFLLFIYEIVYKKVIKLFWLFLLAFIMINLTAFIGSEGIFYYMLPLGIVIAIMAAESIRVFTIGIIKKLEYIWILSTGAVMFILLTLTGIFFQELLFEPLRGSLFILQIVVLPVSMAIYLAKSYAKTNDDLEKQIITVKELSSKQIEQEKINSELRLQAELERKENERKSEELEQARNLQLSMLPKVIPSIPNLEISVYMQTATEVGGDYYDFNLSETGILTAAVGDATGHGLNAGMMVSITKGLFQNLAGMPDLESSFKQFNHSIFSMDLQPLLMSLLAVKIDNYKIDLVNAGMPDVYIYKKEQNKVIEIEACGPPLGALDNFHYKVITEEIEPGDVILLMSDGFTERFNKDDEMFGCAKCKNLFKENAASSTEEIINRFVEAEKAWSEDRERDDDVTFVVIKCKK